MLDSEKEQLTKKKKLTTTDDDVDKPVNQSQYSESTLRKGGFAGLPKRKKIIIIAVIILVVIGVALAIALPLALKHKDEPPTPVPPDEPFNYPEYNPYVFDSTQNISTNAYTADFTLNLTSSQVHSQPHKLGDPINGKVYKPVDSSKIINSINKNNWAKQIRFTVDMNSNNQARMVIKNTETDPNNIKKMLVGEDLLQRPDVDTQSRLSQVGFSVATDAGFNFNFKNIYTGETVISTKYRKLLVSDFYSEMGLILPTQKCYGLGQRNGKFQLQQGTYSLSARGRDEGLPTDDQLGGKNGNHIHPFLLCQTSNPSDFFGIFFASTFPQVFEVIHFEGESKMVLNYINLGQVMEMFFFIRGSAQSITQMYHQLIGTPMMPPYYALGMFQGSNTYDTLTKIQNVVTGYQNQIFEGVFIDSYNQNPHWSFTVHSTNFFGLSAYMDTMRTSHQRAIFGASYALANSPDYSWYNTSIQNQCFINSSTLMYSQKQLIGILDQTQVNYLDAYHNNFYSYIKQAYAALNTSINGTDGYTVKDHYLPNHISGEVNQTTPKPSQLKKGRLLAKNEDGVGWYSSYLVNVTDGEYSTYALPFIPGWDYQKYLDNMTISMNVTQGDSNPIYHFALHNGVAQKALQQTYYQFHEKINENTTRPLLFTDASWSGSGSMAVGLITDIYRSWDNLKYVLSQALSMSLYGMSNTMIDVCGSLGPMDRELCARWAQLAAFMPMARNYYNDTYRDPVSGNRSKTAPSEFYNLNWGNDTIGPAFAQSQDDRLAFSRYIYTQLYEVSKNGGSIVKPLFFDYPEDSNAFDETTYMLGDALKVSPVLEAGLNDTTKFASYFPKGTWLGLTKEINYTMFDKSAGGGYEQLNGTFASTNVHLKGGKIIPYVNHKRSYYTTRDVELNVKTAFIIYPDQNGKAEGKLYLDDGITVESNYVYWNIRYVNQTINFMVQAGDIDYEPAGLKVQYLDYIEIYNVTGLDNMTFACYLGAAFNPTNLKFDYNPDTKILKLSSKSSKTNISIKDLGTIKFGDSAKDPDFCSITTSASAFTFTAQNDTTVSNATYWKYNLTSTQATVVAPLVAEFTLLDDQGTINVDITSQDDFNSNKTKIYRVPQPEYYSLSMFKVKSVTKQLTDFMTVNETQFSYSYYQNASNTTSLLWQSDPNKLYLSDYMIMDSGIFDLNFANNDPLIGIGEKAGSIFYSNENNGVHTRYTYDEGNPIDDGKPPGKNYYGYQPFYAFQSSTTDWVGVFDISSYATDYIINSKVKTQSTMKNDPGFKTQITKITIGGTINKMFFQGQKVDDLIVKYQKMVGNPLTPPLWAFGWQQCRWGYTNSSQWWNAYANYTTNNLPLDVMWADIDYMDDYKIFTISNESYVNFTNLVNQVKADGRKFVPIIDPGVAVRDSTYQTYKTGIEQNVFILQQDQKTPLTAGVWPGNVHFPDFFKDSTVTWWKSNFDYLYNNDTGLGLQFDGIWLDMNEASNFCNGYCVDSERPTSSIKDKIPYIPGSRDLEAKSIGIDGYHSDIKRSEYDVHNLYALKQTQATASYLIDKFSKNGIKYRPYILTRSNSPGIGKYAHHWLGDNNSDEESLGYSVDGIFSYQLFGMPFVGSDVCGFNNDAQADVCTRWHQLGSLYPFSRNHNSYSARSQEPYMWTNTLNSSTTTTYLDVIREALRNRYTLISYYYSNFHSISAYGGSFFKPLFFEFSNDANCYDETDVRNNIMLGSALKASINTQNVNKDKTDYYFPAGRWCQIIPSIDKSSCFDTDKGQKVSLSSYIADYQVHMRGGYIISQQDAKNKIANYTGDLTNMETNLWILPNSANSLMTLPSQDNSINATAMGYVYFDDGVSTFGINRFDIYTTYNETDKTFKLNVLNVSVGDKGDMKNRGLQNITFLWASKNGMDQLNKAQMQLNLNNTAVDMQNKPMYDKDLDVLVLNMTYTDSVTNATAQWSLWDFSQITLSQVA